MLAFKRCDNQPLTLVLRYAFFALVATSANLMTQWLCLRPVQMSSFMLYIAMAAGTATGLFTKYVLDKKWIFYYKSMNARDDAERFLLYSLMGGFTTGIFWATEIGFYHFFDFSGAHYVGGALGLSVGYTAKYFLDRKYVFPR